jgi:hypothetical protein
MPVTALKAVGVLSAAVFALSLSLTALAADKSAACDRICLQKFVGEYAAALVKHDPAGLRVAANARVSENSESVSLGAGPTWQGITSFKSQPQYVADVPAQEVGYVGVVDDAGKTAFLGLRLKIRDNAITEVESVLTHDGEGGPAFEPEGFVYREAPYIRDVPVKVRSSRAELAKATDIYWDVSTNTHDGSQIPYATDCWHYENGMNTNWERFFNPSELSRLDRPEYQPQPADGRIWVCAREPYLSTTNWVKARDRHYLLDEERGLVFQIVYVDVKGRSPLNGPVTTGNAAARGGGPGPGGPGGPGGAASREPIEGPGAAPLGMSMVGMRASMAGTPHTMVHFDVMRIVGGKIAREQDVMRMLPEAAKRQF